MKNSILPIILLFFSSIAAYADTVVIGADRDTSIYSDSATNPDGTHSSGGSISLFAGRIFPVTDERRSLLSFDITSAVPSGALIENVELTLTVFRNSIRDAQPSDEFALHRLTTDWGEGTVTPGEVDGHGDPADNGDATWFSNSHNNTTWTTPGGDFDPIPSAVSPIGGLVNNTGDSLSVVWSDQGLIDDVQNWLDDDVSNFGWILAAGANNGQKSARIFGSRERSEGMPQLLIEFSAVPEPCSSIMLLLGGTIALVNRRKIN